MRHFGIIGFPLLHSFSAKFFNEKFATQKIDAEYSLYPMKELTSERMNELTSERPNSSICSKCYY